jgi:hypothetical protein
MSNSSITNRSSIGQQGTFVYRKLDYVEMPQIKLKTARDMGKVVRIVGRLTTTYLIAAPATFYWASGSNGIENRAEDDVFSSIAA